MQPSGSSGGRLAVVPAVWRDFYEQTHIPAGVIVGDTLRLTGHTGETPDGVFPVGVEDQVRQTFVNIAATLSEAGAEWTDVVELASYHVGLQSQLSTVLKVAAEFLSDPYPAWTAVGVTELIVTEAKIEVSCVAVLEAGRPWRRVGSR